MSIEKVLAKRYAQTLLNLTPPEQIEKIGQELLSITHLYETTKEIREILNHPLISAHEKKGLLQRTLGNRVTPTILRFLELLINKNRIEYLPLITETYDSLADQARGITRVKVKYAIDFTDSERRRLISVISGLTSAQQVIIEPEIDPSLLGGITVQIGDTMIDGSVTGRLEDMKQQLLYNFTCR